MTANKGIGKKGKRGIYLNHQLETEYRSWGDFKNERYIMKLLFSCMKDEYNLILIVVVLLT